jgi:hypothetical protein
MSIVPAKATPGTCTAGYELRGITLRCTEPYGHGGQRHAHGDLEWSASSPNHWPYVDPTPTVDR